MHDIEFAGVCRSFGTKTVLRDLHLTLEAGKITALSGPSGVGKTTVLRMIAGLERPDAGDILGAPPMHDVSYVFQEPRLLPWLTARDNIRCVLADRRDRAGTADRFLETVELTDAACQLPEQLSGGMQQRVSLARALAAERPVLLMDEPFRGLDIALRDRLIERILPLLAGKTVIFVTHSPEEAEAVADRTFVLTPPVT